MWARDDDGEDDDDFIMIMMMFTCELHNDDDDYTLQVRAREDDSEEQPKLPLHHRLQTTQVF